MNSSFEKPISVEEALGDTFEALDSAHKIAVLDGLKIEVTAQLKRARADGEEQGLRGKALEHFVGVEQARMRTMLQEIALLREQVDRQRH